MGIHNFGLLVICYIMVENLLRKNIDNFKPKFIVSKQQYGYKQKSIFINNC